MALVYQETRAEAVCSLEQDVLVLLNDKSRMKGDLHVRFREKFEVKVLLLTRLRGRRLITASYSISLLKAAVHCADTFKGRGESRVQGLGIIWELSDLTFRKKGEDDR